MTPSGPELLSRIQNYLEVGGLWNPELMDHDKVRQLITDCRIYIGEKELNAAPTFIPQSTFLK